MSITSSFCVNTSRAAMALSVCYLSISFGIPCFFQGSTQPAAANPFVCPPCPCSSCGKTYKEAGRCPDCGMTLVEKKKIMNVAIVVWQGVELLDFAGPGEVFAAARAEDGRSFRTFTVSKSKQPIKSQGFLTVTPQFDINDCPEIDILVLPGGGTASVTDDPEFMEWIKNRIEKSEIALSVCTGAFILAKHGYLDNAESTTWHGATDDLQKQFPKTTVRTDRRFIDNGKIVTSAGVSAGIDSSLHLVARLYGKVTAEKTAQYMEYDWRYAELED